MRAPITDVREAFHRQAGHCQRLGSDFTAQLCAVLGARLDDSSAFGRRVLGWPVEKAGADALALRCCGALHALARAGSCAALNAVYPPNALPDPNAMWLAVNQALTDHDAALTAFLDGPPQTNEVARSGVLLGGFLTIARETGFPLAIFEIGSSAGLNLLFDRYSYQIDEARVWGDPRSAVVIPCAWEGALPALDLPLHVVSRAGCDVKPLRAADPSDRARLLSYIWPDQRARVARIAAALETVANAGICIETADAAEWVARQLPPGAGPEGVCRVLFHSIMWQYMPAPTQDAVRAHILGVGAAATPERPFAWLRLEDDGQDDSGLRLTLWPGGEERLLARAGFHGRSSRWL